MTGDDTCLAELARVLWPGGGPIRRGGAATRGREYLPLPSALRPRLLLPLCDRSAARHGLAAFARRRTAAERVRAALLDCSLATGAAPLLLRDRVRVPPGPAIEDALAAALDQELVAAVHIGPPRANRKPVLLLLTPRGRTVGYAKVGVNELTEHLVCAEAAALRRLGAARLPDVAVPRLLHSGKWQGRPFLVQTALSPEGRSRPPTRPRLLRCVAQIASIDRVRHRPLSSSPYLRRLLQRVSDLGPSAEAAALRTALTRLPDVRLPFGAWHGDLTRWNTADTRGRTLVWDWERLGFDVPVGFDALHYELHEALHRDPVKGMRHWSEEASRILRDPLLGRMGLPAENTTAVMSLYLADLAARYLHDRQEEAGSRLAPVGSRLLPALHALGERAMRS